MFTCSICNETFVGIHHDTTYTTQCGHVFHHECLKKWLTRSKTCPHCRSPVLENNLIKLFLQVDSNAQVTLADKKDETIFRLKENLRRLKEKETHSANTIYCLETQLKHSKNAIELSKASFHACKKEAENQKKYNSEISDQLTLKTIKCNESEIERNKFQAGYSLLQSKIKSLNHELYDLQSANSSVIDELKVEIANLKSEKAYFQSRCYNIENINIEQPSTSKINIENKNAMSLQNKTKSEYYGNDPQLNTPTKRFLLGCVFLFVEGQIQQEDNNICNKTTPKDNIIKYGGLVEQFYSPRITHVICVTQKHCIVEQGMKDGKRCVTDYWLSDIISKKSMIQPWRAIHFPIPYRMDNLPCQNFQISIVNFGINEGHIVKAMIEQVGGGYSFKKVTSRTDVVISRKLEGELVEKALAINKPVVSVQWLNDILFGSRLGIKEPGNIKYQQFDICDPFLVNYDMVSSLMEAWKTPLSINKNQQVYDLTLNSDSPTKCKRQKTMSECHNMKNLINDDNDDNDDDDVVITYIKSLPSKPCAMFCGFSNDDQEIFKMILLLLGGTATTHCLEASHLVMNKPIPSIELFGCLPTVKFILNENWLKDSHSSLKFQDEKKYCIEHIQDKFLGSCYLPPILEKKNRRLLFKDLSFFVTPGIIYPPSKHLELIISSSGGKIERIRRSLESIRCVAPNSYFIISCEEDYCLYNDLSDIDNVVYLPEFITCSVLAQQVQLQKFLLNVTAQN
ncbi:unnamed protein product [Macrosiphum euphorbiae]|uniref:PAX-interacting protein 1 n=1 Tax=Macrosiphum euphorbiae TaxID=13131 RepID=A0AAV0WWN7_9HEMI|nr:unnamed protein product [Macrosiphum euphorbiae]